MTSCSLLGVSCFAVAPRLPFKQLARIRAISTKLPAWCVAGIKKGARKTAALRSVLGQM